MLKGSGLGRIGTRGLRWVYPELGIPIQMAPHVHPPCFSFISLSHISSLGNGDREVCIMYDVGIAELGR